MTQTKRIGAKSRDAVDPQVLERLNRGVEETATLAEALAVDFGTLLACIAPDMSPRELQRMGEARTLGVTKRMDMAAMLLAMHFGKGTAARLKHHPSDTVRGWAAFVVGRDTTLSLAQKLSSMQSLAEDRHFGVREWAWLALRDSIASEVLNAVQALLPWVRSTLEDTTHPDYLRRFAIEATRPRGVWSKHIAELKESPRIGRPLLDEVMEDQSRYVQDSCGNWLNDAAKSRPDWVVEFCREWRDRNPSASVDYIARRALRSIA